jgi:hypothetical protein
MHQWCDGSACNVACTPKFVVRGDSMITVGKVRDADYYLEEVTADDAHSYYADCRT